MNFSGMSVHVVRVYMLQERETGQLLAELDSLQRSKPISVDDRDEPPPELQALKTANSKLKYRIAHLKKVKMSAMLMHCERFMLSIFIPSC